MADSPHEPAADTPTPPHPPSDYRVALDAYAGPLDLLLYLVKRHEIDLNDIPIAQLTEQYLQHLKVIESLPGAGGGVDVDRAGEFLVMAATLVEIKSATLMPAIEAEEEEADGAPEPETDPRFELVQQLLAYKKFKDASTTLDARRAQWDERYPAQAKPGKPPEPAGGDPEDDPDAQAPPVELDLEDVGVMDLCAAFGRMLDAIGFVGDHAVTYDDTPISLHADDIADRLERDGAPAGPHGRRSMTLQQIFTGRRSRSEMIGLFLATLELVRQRRVVVVQDPAGGDVRLETRDPADREDLDGRDGQASPDWTNPETGEVEYEWPDDESRRRAERRAKLRAVYAAKGQSPPDGADDISDEGPHAVQPIAEPVGGGDTHAPLPDAGAADTDAG